MSAPSMFTPLQRRALLFKAATLVAQLLPLADVLATNSFTAAERERFRKLAGEDRVLALLEALRPVSSAVAYDLYDANRTSITLALVEPDTGKVMLRSFPRPQADGREGGAA